MEEKSNCQFFRYLSARALKIRVVETAIISGSIVDTIVFLDESGHVKKQNTKPISLFSYMQKIIEENEIKSKVFRLQNSKLCFFYKSGQRKTVTESMLKDFLVKKKTFRGLEMIQKLNSSQINYEKIYKAKILYVNKEYKSEFTLKRSQINDPMLLSTMTDISRMIISALERTELKRVLQIELDLLRDINGCIWVLNCSKCILVEPQYTLKLNFSSETDISQLAKTMPKSLIQPIFSPKRFDNNKYYQISSKATEAVDKLYTFHRGQLRNTGSNLNSPIRMQTPSRVESNEESQNMHSNPSQCSLPETKGLLTKYLCNSPEGLKTTNKTKKHRKEDAISSLHEAKAFQYLSPVRKNELKRSGNYRKTDVIMGKNFDIRRPMRTLTKTGKSLTLKRRSTLMFEDNFMELIVRTFDRNKGKSAEQEFGIGPSVSPDEFFRIMNRKGNKEDSEEGFSAKIETLRVKPVLGSEEGSKLGTPNGKCCLKNAEGIRMKNKVKPKIQDMAVLAKRKTLERINILITSPKSPKNFLLKQYLT
jgi:hypothetical protein